MWAMRATVDWIEVDTPPETGAGVVYWRARLGAAHVLLRGRGAPRRGSSASDALLPANVASAWLEQVHSNRVLEADQPGRAGRADGIVVGLAGLAATVAAADCVPVLLAAPGRVAAVHAGWRGLAAGIVESAARGLDRPVAWIGPAIGPCCYEVGEDVASAVVAASDESIRRPGPKARPHLDLALAAAVQLASAHAERIQVLRHCTSCRVDWLESHRRDGEAAGRNLASIWLPVA